MPKIVDPLAQRKRIIEAAISVIDRDGIDGAKLRDVARAAGVTTGTIMHYFESKREVLEGVLSEITRRTIERMNGALLNSGVLTPSAFINEAIQHLPINDQYRTDWRVWLAYCGSGIGDPELLRMHQRHHRKIVSRVLSMLLRLGHVTAPEPIAAPTQPMAIPVRDGQVVVVSMGGSYALKLPKRPPYSKRARHAADAVVAAIEGIGIRASLDPVRWPTWRQAEVLSDILIPILQNYVEKHEINRISVKATRLAA